MVLLKKKKEFQGLEGKTLPDMDRTWVLSWEKEKHFLLLFFWRINETRSSLFFCLKIPVEITFPSVCADVFFLLLLVEINQNPGASYCVTAISDERDEIISFFF